MPTTRCPSCASEVPSESRFCLSCGAPLASSSELATVAMPARSASSGSFDEGRFPPGMLLDRRYRIVGMLGRGGMGQVYRVQDLKLAAVFVGGILILTRFGLLPMIVGLMVSVILPNFPMTLDFSAWYSGATLFAVVVVLALTAYAFDTARAGRLLFREGALDR
jgi:hypothetical protein